MSETHTKTGEGVLVDAVRENPVDQYLLRRRRRVLLILLLVVVLVAGFWWYRCRRDGGGAGHGFGASSGSMYSALRATEGAAV